MERNRNILVYFAWEEDIWLDEFLDRFREVNAMIPNLKSLQMLQEEQSVDAPSNLVIVVNVGEGKEETEGFLQALTQSSLYTDVPLFFVGISSDEEQAEWSKRYPRAKGIVVQEHTWDHDYEPILSLIEAEWTK